MNFFERLSGYGYVCAHRGARSIAPENTMLALVEARRCGADLWEADVQFTADGKLVIFHDDRLERTTDISARPEYAGRKPWQIADFSLVELQSWMSGPGLSMPTPMEPSLRMKLHRILMPSSAPRR